MIPENWHNVYNVTMTEIGTQVKRFSDSSDVREIIKEELGDLKVNDVLFKLSKKILLVEGITDKSCIEKIAPICGYDLKEYDIVVCHGYPIIALAHLCIKEDIPFRALMDADMREKFPALQNQRKGWECWLEEIKNNSNCIFVSQNGKRQCLEDCFAESDAKRYFSKKKFDQTNPSVMKIDEKKIANGKEFDDETLNNFITVFKQLGVPKLKPKK